MSYVVDYARGKRFTIGRAGVLTPMQARDEAKKKLADAVRGQDPMAARRAARARDLKSFIEAEYEPWVKANHRGSEKTLQKIRSFFAELGDKKLAELNTWLIDKWKTTQLKAGRRPTGINRDVAALKAALSGQVFWPISSPDLANPFHSWHSLMDKPILN